MANENQHTASDSSVHIEVLVIVIIALSATACYFGFQYFKTKKGAPASSSGGGDLVNSNNMAIASSTAPASSPNDFASSGSDASEPSTAVAATPSAGSVFPLMQVYGAALHTANPYVKDLQQYLNKFKQATLDVDGAFGVDTAADVMKAFGVPQVTQYQYNDVIAPALGKPQV